MVFKRNPETKDFIDRLENGHIYKDMRAKNIRMAAEIIKVNIKWVIQYSCEKFKCNYESA